MNAVAKKEIEAQVVNRLGQVFERHEKRPQEILTSGIVEIDQVLGGFPRGAITEIHGAASCGHTSLMLATLTAATSSEETCALIDCCDTFDLLSATRAGVNFDHLLWVRCNYNLEQAFKSTDLLLHSGGFGLIALSLAEMPARTLRRILSTWWFRFRRAIENTPTVLLVMAPIACARSCAAMALELKNVRVMWPATTLTENKDLPDCDDRSSPHLSLVSPGDRNAHHPPALPGHTQFLSASTISVNRQRPVDWVNQIIQFTPHLALTVFGDIR